MFRTRLAAGIVASGSPRANGQTLGSDQSVLQYLFIRTVAFVALTSASTVFLALPHIIQN